MEDRSLKEIQILQNKFSTDLTREKCSLKENEVKYVKAFEEVFSNTKGNFLKDKRNSENYFSGQEEEVEDSTILLKESLNEERIVQMSSDLEP